MARAHDLDDGSLNAEDVWALKRSRAAGHSVSELHRKDLRVVASRYYTGRRPPSTLFLESTDTKLGDESSIRIMRPGWRHSSTKSCC